MGPERGTEKYNEQIERIVLALGGQGFTVEQLDGLILLYVFDKSYSRGAILEARKRILDG